MVVTATVASLWLFSAGKEGQHWQQYLSRGSLLLFHRWACTGGVSSVTLHIYPCCNDNSAKSLSALLLSYSLSASRRLIKNSAAATISDTGTF